MPSSDARRALGASAALLVALTSSPSADAQQPAQGFAVERFYPSAPTGGWFVMDSLDMRGGLGGAMALTTGYSRAPLRIRSGGTELPVVTDQAFVDFGFAATWNCFRLYLQMDAPLVDKGRSGIVGDSSFTGPSLDLGSSPDVLSDVRIGTDVRIDGDADSPFRLGVGAQLVVPSGERADYVTDGTYRAMGRVLFSRRARSRHLCRTARRARPSARRRRDAREPARQRAPLRHRRRSEAPDHRQRGDRHWTRNLRRDCVSVLFGGTTTALEGLLGARIEETGTDGPQVRVKLGTGAGLDAHFGAPEWRLLVGVEVFGYGKVMSLP